MKNGKERSYAILKDAFREQGVRKLDNSSIQDRSEICQRGRIFPGMSY